MGARAPHRFIAAAALGVVIVLVAACGVSVPKVRMPLARSPSPSPTPSFTPFSDRQMGFKIALAQGWRLSQNAAPGSVEFSGPGDLAMVVHVEQATSTELSTEAPLLFSELAGGGLGGSHVTRSSLAGYPAEQLTGDLTAAGRAQRIDAYVTVVGGQDWEVAMAGSREPVSATTSTFAQMVATFKLSGG